MIKQKLYKNKVYDLESFYTTGDHLFSIKKYTDALSYYKQALKIKFSLYPYILRKFEKSLIQNDQDIKLRQTLVDLYLFENNYLEAIDELDDIIDLDPANLVHYQKYANILFKQNKYKEIITLLKNIICYQITNEELLASLALAYLESKKNIRAIKIYERLTIINGSKESYLKILSDLYFRNNNYEKAVEKTIKRIDLNKSSANDVIDFIFKCLEKIENKIHISEVLINLCLTYNKPDEALKLISIHIGNTNFNQSLLEESLNRCIKKYEKYPPALNIRGNYYLFHKRLSEAADDYWSIIKNPEYESYAEKGLKEILVTYPNQITALQYLGNYYKNKGNTHEALIHMRHMLNCDFSKSIAIISQCQDLLEDNPKNYYAKLTMAEAYYNRKNYQQAIEISKELLDKNENLLDSYKLLLKSYIGINDFSSFRQYAIQGLSKFANNMDYYKIFQELYHSELNIRCEYYLRKTENSQKLSDKYKYISSLLENQQFEKALVSLQNLTETEITYKKFTYQGLAFLGLGNYYSALENFKQSVNHVQVKTAPEYILSIQMVAKTNEILGHVDKSLTHYRHILELNIQHEYAKIKEEYLKNCPYLEITGISLIAIAETLEENSNFKTVFNRNILKKHRTEGVDSSMGIAKNNEAVDNILKGKINSASDLLEVAYKMDPNHKNILNNRGILSILKKNWGYGNKIFDKILKSRKDISAAALYNRAFIMTYGLKQYKEALKILKVLISFDPHFYEVYLLIGDIHYYLNSLKQAFTNWQIYKDKGLLNYLASNRLLEVEYNK